MAASRIRILNCDSVFCVYNEQRKCSREEITITETGECQHLSHERYRDEGELPPYMPSRKKTDSVT